MCIRDSPSPLHICIRGSTVTVPGIIVEKSKKPNAAFNPLLLFLENPYAANAQKKTETTNVLTVTISVSPTYFVKSFAVNNVE